MAGGSGRRYGKACPQCKGIEEVFDGREARKDLRKYRKKGLSRTTRMLIDAVSEGGVEGRTLLDVGGGIAAIQHELLRTSISAASDVDASSAYIEAARDEAVRQSHEARISFRHGNFVDVADELEQADIVILDRVICCDHDVEKLVSRSAGLAGRVYGVVYPRDNWVFKIGVRFTNVYMWLIRSSFRAYVHPSSTVDGLVWAEGLTRRFYRKTLLWQVVVYSR
jgi:magnesium-protoporphyrin O-methyltransferase